MKRNPFRTTVDLIREYHGYCASVCAEIMSVTNIPVRRLKTFYVVLKQRWKTIQCTES